MKTKPRDERHGKNEPEQPVFARQNKAALFTDTDARAVCTTQAVPLYHQLYALLKSKIESGELPQGSLLPSEIELAERFAVSRITSKRALNELGRDGLVERRAGRGTHVRVRPPSSPVLRAPLTGNLESLNVMGRETTVEVLSFERIPAPKSISDALKIKPHTLVDRAVRVRRNQGLPFAYYLSHTIVLKDSAKDNAVSHTDSAAAKSGPQAMNRKNLKSQTRLEIFRAMGIKLAEVDQVLNAVAANAEVAHALNLSVGAPVLSMTRTYIDSEGRIVDHLVGLYRPDRFEYHMHLSTLDRRK
jgi:GntR family transcriptional regulator